MPAVPLKPEYRPTLAQLLAPRWRRASPGGRLAVTLSVVVLVAALAALVLTLLPAGVSYGGPVPFSFSYRGLYRTTPDRGGLVKVVRRTPEGALEDSFAVEPLQLPAYQGSLSGELPLFAAGYVHALSLRYPGFELRGEGKGKVAAGVVAYNVFYTAVIEGHTMYGRDFLLLPERTGVRRGVDIVMHTTPHANAQVTSPLLVATAGVLYEPLRTFTLD
jgi:hypothetical protein